ncbi:hypothetical protein MKW94_024365 [Papaver nudicaule]|uniref:X8 domain-containing protein n=1 Tax=Papaver nudicaule TaxID=74823 RepID=A0AA41RSD2_PAPNU|nr:hypothetical protein [Papaver nudicaule]
MTRELTGSFSCSFVISHYVLQTWCVARTGLLESALQPALDYACGIPGANCSAIQQMGTCYNPNSLQHHASYAFNNYYHKDPSPSNCDFGGTAMIVHKDPSKTQLCSSTS